MNAAIEPSHSEPSCIEPLVDALIRFGDRGGKTPVLVTPRSIGLRPIFFEAIAEEVIRRTGRSVRIDWYRPSVGLAERLVERFAEPLTRRFARRLNRSLAAIGDARIELTDLIGRPAGPTHELVIGYCRDGIDLPPWGSPVRLFVAAPEPAAFGFANDNGADKNLADRNQNGREVTTRSAA